MTKSPCIGCEFELADKNNPTCRECDRRVEYAMSIKEDMNIEHRTSSVQRRMKEMEIKEPAGVHVEKREYHKTGERKKREKSAGRKEMKNKLLDLNNHMFDQIERLSDAKLKGDKLAEEISRSNAIVSVAGQIISNAGLALKAKVAVNDLLLKNPPKMLGIEGFDAEE